jgi:hypothetical protein
LKPPPQGDSEGPHNLYQLHSIAITWTHLHSPGSSIRSTPTQTRYPGTDLVLRYEVKTGPSLAAQERSHHVQSLIILGVCNAAQLADNLAPHPSS